MSKSTSPQAVSTPAKIKKKKHKKRKKNVPLAEAVGTSIASYFDHLDGHQPTDLYAFVLKEIEPPLLVAVLNHTDHNQSQAAEILGLNRGTLRKKLKQYDLI